MNSNKRKIMIVGTNMMNIYNHRLELINQLIKNNYEVIVAAPYGSEVPNLLKTGCRFIDVDVDNRGTNVKKDLKLISSFISIFKKEKPDVVLTFYTKTNIYGGIAAKLLKIPYIENITGLGSALSGKGLMQKIMQNLYKFAVSDADFIFFQNTSNLNFFQVNKLLKCDWKLLPGSGVSLERFKPLPYPSNNNLEFVFISRIIKEKGIDEYLEVARKVKNENPEIIFHVVGPTDEEYAKIIEEAQKEGIIQYHGKVLDTKPILERSACLVYPSYYAEGMANVLLEAAASARPLITTSLPGCGETVENKKTGFIIKEKDADSLYSAVSTFIKMPKEEREKMGKEGRLKMEKEFNREIVVNAYLEAINKILGKLK